MIKYFMFMFVFVPFFCFAQYKTTHDYFMENSFKNATGENSQLSLDDYKKSVSSLARNERKKLEDSVEQDFVAKDYNKDGLVSRDEYKRYNLIKEKNRKKTKNEERIVKRRMSKGVYVNPDLEINEITKKLDEAMAKQERKEPGHD